MESDELALQGSNLRPPVPKTGVLPTELRATDLTRYPPEPGLAALYAAFIGERFVELFSEISGTQRTATRSKHTEVTFGPLWDHL